MSEWEVMQPVRKSGHGGYDPTVRQLTVTTYGAVLWNKKVHKILGEPERVHIYQMGNLLGVGPLQDASQYSVKVSESTPGKRWRSKSNVVLAVPGFVITKKFFGGEVEYDKDAGIVFVKLGE